jgi:hypothetical protein
VSRALNPDHKILKSSRSTPITNPWTKNTEFYLIIPDAAGAFLLGRKDNMARACARFRRIFGPESFPYFPKTWILPADRADLMSDWESRKESGQLYIYKPPAGCKGIGIRIITDPATQIKQQANAVVSHYIDDPFLVDGLKFDMRIYVVITCFQPLRVYIHEQGLVRFCTAKYDGNAKKTRKNRYRHLTNYSLNKNSKNFVRNEDEGRDDVGHKWSLRAFKAWMSEHGHDFDKVYADIEVRCTPASHNDREYRHCVDTLMSILLKNARCCHA